MFALKRNPAGKIKCVAVEMMGGVLIVQTHSQSGSLTFTDLLMQSTNPLNIFSSDRLCLTFKVHIQ